MTALQIVENPGLPTVCATVRSDSLLEQRGFEPPVPSDKKSNLWSPWSRFVCQRKPGDEPGRLGARDTSTRIRSIIDIRRSLRNQLRPSIFMRCSSQKSRSSCMALKCPANLSFGSANANLPTAAGRHYRPALIVVVQERPRCRGPYRNCTSVISLFRAPKRQSPYCRQYVVDFQDPHGGPSLTLAET
jgi:hypothetical protein